MVSLEQPALHHAERIPWIEAAQPQRAAGLSFRPADAFNFSNSPHSRGHVPMNHSDTFLRSHGCSPVRPPDAIIVRRFVRDLVRYHFTKALVAPIYYVSQIGREFFPSAKLFSVPRIIRLRPATGSILFRSKQIYSICLARFDQLRCL